MGWKMASPTDGTDLEASLLSFEKLDRASPDLWPEQLPGVAEFAASFKSPITSSPPKWMAEIERDDIDMLKELGSLTTANLMEKVRGLQNLAYQLGLDEFCLTQKSGLEHSEEAQPGRLPWSCSAVCRPCARATEHVPPSCERDLSIINHTAAFSSSSNASRTRVNSSLLLKGHS
ncbi:protein lin-52 homolog isoform X1 [Erinaceus europaeus]|uniref:Protein lin-52 homolog n=2 Tax=Laurasiatheria TaxID=314145 RepID=A0ABM3W4K0_ERIEU|nr:protein lin-52 homolog isoform X1 [Erinaceus europaeus]